MEAKPLKVMMVDDERRLCVAWAKLLGAEPDMDVLEPLDRADRLVEVIRERRPDVVLLDLTLPGRDPLEVLSEAVEQCPESRIIIYSGFSDPETVQRAIDAGAWGLVDKLEHPRQVIEAIRRVSRGELSYPGGPRF